MTRPLDSLACWSGVSRWMRAARLRAGVLLERFAQRQMLDSALCRQPLSIRRQEGEGRFRVAFVLGQVQRHCARPDATVGSSAAGMPERHPYTHGPPLERAHRERSTSRPTRKRRGIRGRAGAGPQHAGCQLLGIRRRRGWQFPGPLLKGDMAQPGKVGRRQFAEKRPLRRQGCLQLRRRQVQQARGQGLFKGLGDPGRRRQRRSGGLILDLVQVEMLLRRYSEGQCHDSDHS